LGFFPGTGESAVTAGRHRREKIVRAGGWGEGVSERSGGWSGGVGVKREEVGLGDDLEVGKGKGKCGGGGGEKGR
jgi:hypothetical protein